MITAFIYLSLTTMGSRQNTNDNNNNNNSSAPPPKDRQKYQARITQVQHYKWLAVSLNHKYCITWKLFNLLELALKLKTKFGGFK